MANSPTNETNIKHTTSTSIDLSVFKHDYECTDFQACQCISRVLSTLKNWTLLKPQQNKQNKSIFI